MPTLNDIYSFLDETYPFRLQEEYDNAGIMCGDLDAPVKKILLSLDVTGDVILEAERIGADLIISHHPVIFDPIKSVLAQDVGTKLIYMLVSRKIACISAHTNLDAARGGVNDRLAKLLELKNVQGFAIEQDGADFGRIGDTGVTSPEEFARLVKSRLGCDTVGLVKGRDCVGRVAVLGGSGSGCLKAAVEAGAGTFVTGEFKHDALLRAKEYGINVVVAGHYYTESPVMYCVMERISGKFPDVNVLKTAVHECPVKAY